MNTRHNVIALLVLLSALMGSHAAQAANIIAYTTPRDEASADCASTTQAIQGEPFVINYFQITSYAGTGPILWRANVLSLAGASGFVRMDAKLPNGWYTLETWAVMEDDAGTTNYCKTSRKVLVRSITYAPEPKKKLAPIKTNYMLR